MLQSFMRHIAGFDWLLQGAVFLLLGLGLISLFSLASVSSFPFFQRQLLWVGIGVTSMLVGSSIDFRIFRTQTFAVLFAYVLTFLLLVVVLLGHLRVRGVESWISIGGFTLQPVEPAKLALIILLAKFFSKRHIEIYRIQHLIVSGLYAALPISLVLLQPDLGSAIVLMSIWVIIVIFSGMKLRHFFILLFLSVFMSVAVWNCGLHSYQKTRITSFLNPYADAKGAGYQMIQSMIAIGSGKIWGKGLGYGSQSHLNFLPEAEADFIFAAYAEEWGFIGVIVLLSLFSLVLWRIIRIGTHASDNFSRLYTIGFAALIFVQSFVHLGTNMGIVPITGITLPFVSYGGSSLVVLLIGVGLLQNIKINSRLIARGYEKDTGF